MNPIEFAKNKPITTAAIVGGVIVVALFMLGPSGSQQQGNASDYFIQGPSDAQIQASSNYQIAQAQIAAERSLAELTTQKDIALAGLQRDVSLAQLTRDDAADARANATTVSLATLQTQLGISNNNRDIAINASNNAAANYQVKRQTGSNTSSIIGSIGQVAGVIGGLFGL